MPRLALLALAFFVTAPAFADFPVAVDEESGIEELNPFAQEMGAWSEEEPESFWGDIQGNAGLTQPGCYQHGCALFVDIDRASQTLRLYVEGRYVDQYYVSTGAAGYRTPSFNKRFDGRIYRRYSSSKYPGGDYRGLGNMPYAMFISGGFALHGTPEGNWARLGRPASHGCIRVHPYHAAYINSILRQVGAGNSWIRVR